MSATTQFLMLLKTDETLVRLACEYVSIQSNESFEKLFANLLMQYSKELRMAASVPSEIEAAEWVETQKHIVAHIFRTALHAPDMEKLRLMDSLQSETFSGEVVLRRFLESVDQDDGSSDSTQTLYEAGVEGSAPWPEENQEAKLQTKENDTARNARNLRADVVIANYEERDISLDLIKDYMILTSAFSNLKLNL